jgi:hypothetical protein
MPFNNAMQLIGGGRMSRRMSSAVCAPSSLKAGGQLISASG